MAADNWLAAFADPQLTAAVAEAIAAQRRPARRRRARRTVAAIARLAGAKLYPSVDLLARGGGKMSGDNSGLTGRRSPSAGSWICGAACATAARRRAPTPRRRRPISSSRGSRSRRGWPESWFLAVEAALQAELARRTVRATPRRWCGSPRPRPRRRGQRRGCLRRPRGRRAPTATACGRSSSRANRRSAPWKSCSADIRRRRRRHDAAARAAPSGARRTALATSRAAPGRHRRRAARGRGVQSHRRGEGGATADRSASRPA